jgi:toxin FitB
VLTFHRETVGGVADLLIDTDVFIDHLRGARELRPNRHRLSYSVITRAELFAGSTATDLSVRLLAPFRELEVTRDVAERAGRIVREFGTRLPDALIAATALEYGLSLVSRNRKDFEPIRGLRIRKLAEDLHG